MRSAISTISFTTISMAESSYGLDLILILLHNRCQLSGPLDAARAGLERDHQYRLSFELLYSTISVAAPGADSVRPPSRIANASPWSMAIGFDHSIVVDIVPWHDHLRALGRFATPVSSVVQK